MQHRQLPLRVALTVLLSVLPAFFSLTASAQENDSDRRVVDTQLVVKGNERMEKFLQAVLDANTPEARRRPPEPVTVLQRAQLQERELTRALRSEGYYASTIESRFAGYRLDDPALFEQLETIDRGDRIEVRFDVEVGPRYKFKPPVILRAEDGQEVPQTLVPREQLEVEGGSIADSAKVIAADEQIVRQLREHGHPYARIDNREAVVDHADRSMTVTWKVLPGPVAQFGTVEFKGLERTREDFLRKYVPFRPGEQYTPARVDEMRDALQALGIFSTVKTVDAPQLDAQNRLPIAVEVVERAPRTIGLGASYATSEGFGATAYWQHRNLFGGAESLRLSAEVGGLLHNKLTEPSFGLYAKYREPDFQRLDQDLTADLYAERKILDAYTKQAIGAGVGLERTFGEGLKGTAGILVEQSIQTRDDNRERFTLVGLPLTLALDRSNDLLNPTEGFRLTAALTPFVDVLDTQSRFIVGRLTGTAYLDLSSDKTTVLAGRAGIASLLDLGNSLVPFDRRIYAGGGGSVRGYEYQSLGPRDGNDPLGGRSSIELSAELRQRISGRFGMVAFVDAGNVWETSTPKPQQGLQYAAGLGARYYTDFGPLRLDVAVPLNRRKGDDYFGLYVSLGQAF
ncbi:MAG: autotransporter assembly complex family protein [Reyranellaceae bacterium]